MFIYPEELGVYLQKGAISQMYGTLQSVLRFIKTYSCPKVNHHGTRV